MLKLLTYSDVEVQKEAPKTVSKSKVESIVVPQPEPVPETKSEVVTKPEPVQSKETIVSLKPVVQPEPIKVEEPKDETIAPDWLVDDDDEKKTVETEGERYELDDNLIIKLMVIGDKELRKSITSRWDELNAYLGHPTLGDLVALLKDGSPLVVTKDAILLVYDFEKLASKANVKINSNRISEILNKMLGREMFVYAISRSESTRLVKAYQNLRQISKLPLPKDIHITLEDLRK